MEGTEILRLISVFVLIIAIPLFFYFLFRVLKSKRKIKIYAQWSDIKKHIALDELQRKTNLWKERGYNVSELEFLIKKVRENQ